MSQPFLSEIKMFGFNFAPRGWAQCEGQILPISQNQALFSLLGTTYGGDGRTTFGLPDLRGRSPRKTGDTGNLGQQGGVETVTIDASTMPAHTHAIVANGSGAANASVPTNNFMNKVTIAKSFAPAGGGIVGMTENTISSFGSSGSHPNMQPFLVMNFCIALQGTFPSRN